MTAKGRFFSYNNILSVNVPCATSKGFVLLHVQRKVVNWIFSFFISFSFLWLELCALKCCTSFKELSLFIGRRQSFLRNTKTYTKRVFRVFFAIPKHIHIYIYIYIYIYNLNILFSLPKVFYKWILTPMPIWFVFEL